MFMTLANVSRQLKTCLPLSQWLRQYKTRFTDAHYKQKQKQMYKHIINLYLAYSELWTPATVGEYTTINYNAWVQKTLL